jgi:hypothetical protein
MFLSLQLYVPIMNALLIPVAYDFFFSCFYLFFTQEWLFSKMYEIA